MQLDKYNLNNSLLGDYNVITSLPNLSKEERNRLMCLYNSKYNSRKERILFSSLVKTNNFLSKSEPKLLMLISPNELRLFDYRNIIFESIILINSNSRVIFNQDNTELELSSNSYDYKLTLTTTYNEDNIFYLNKHNDLLEWINALNKVISRQITREKSIFIKKPNFLISK